MIGSMDYRGTIVSMAAMATISSSGVREGTDCLAGEGETELSVEVEMTISMEGTAMIG